MYTFCQGKGTLKQEPQTIDLMSQERPPKVSQEPRVPLASKWHGRKDKGHKS